MSFKKFLTEAIKITPALINNRDVWSVSEKNWIDVEITKK